MNRKDTVAIGSLDPGHVDGMFYMSVAGVYKQRDRVKALLRIENGGLLSRGRCELVQRFLWTTDCQWLLMIDSDQQISLDAFDKLINTADDAHPIVAGLYFGSWPGEVYPTAVPLIFTSKKGTTRYIPIDDYPTDKVIEVDSAGTGCLLIHRSVFEKFQADAGPHDTNWCWFRDMPVNGDWFSEDHFFCARAKEMGYQIYAHTGAVLPHRKRFWMSDQHHTPSAAEAMSARDAEKKAPAEVVETAEAEKAPEKAVKPRAARKR